MYDEDHQLDRELRGLNSNPGLEIQMRIPTTAAMVAVTILTLSIAHAARTYQAVCGHEAHDGTGGYSGPIRNNAQDARDDCSAHERSFPGHRCNVNLYDD